MSIWISAKRVVRYGMIGFFRNGFVSLAAVSIMMITLFVIAGLMMAGAALNSTLQMLSEQVDINVYFLTDASEDRIFEVRDALEGLPEVATVEYVSRDEALARFQQRHAGDHLTLQALDELDDNPLGASLAVRAHDPSQYEQIAEFLESDPVVVGGDEPIVEKVNFFQNRTVIERLSNIIETSHKIGIGITIALGLASLLIAFNTIRLAIYTSRDEIGVMKLVGAGPWYVRGPFVIAGLLYGIVAGLLVLVAMYPISLYLGEPSQRFFGNFNTFTYYIDSFPMLFVTIIGLGMVLGALSSFLAVRRYLRN